MRQVLFKLRDKLTDWLTIKDHTERGTTVRISKVVKMPDVMQRIENDDKLLEEIELLC
jgi:hypothetical protein